MKSQHVAQAPPQPSAGLIPTDLAAWCPPDRLAQLARQATASLEDLPVVIAMDAAPACYWSGHELLALLVYAYARGVLGSVELERWAATAPEVAQLGFSHRVDADLLQRVRRRHRPLLQEALSRLLGLAWQEHVWLNRARWQMESAWMDFHLAARRRLDLAMYHDSMEQDD